MKRSWQIFIIKARGYPRAAPGLAPAHPSEIDSTAHRGSSTRHLLARDINRFEKQGYKLEKIKAVDMFPQTMHVETVVLMSRK